MPPERRSVGSNAAASPAASASGARPVTGTKPAFSSSMRIVPGPAGRFATV